MNYNYKAIEKEVKEYIAKSNKLDKLYEKVILPHIRGLVNTIDKQDKVISEFTKWNKKS